MIILASQSPRRRELMKLITPDFTVKVSDVDETLPKGIAPEQILIAALAYLLLQNEKPDWLLILALVYILL